MSGIKGGPCGQKIQCQDPCKNPCNPCQKVPICVAPCQDPCKPGLQYHGLVYKQDPCNPCNPCCPDPCQDQGSYCCNK